MNRAQMLHALQTEMKKWDNQFEASRQERRRLEMERADARSNEVMSVALLLGFTGAEMLGSPFVAGCEADTIWKAEHEQKATA